MDKPAQYDYITQQTIVEVKHPARPDEALCRLLADLGLRITDEPVAAVNPVR